MALISQEIIAEIIDAQNENRLKKDPGIERDKLKPIKLYRELAITITGVRRCGKSTLMR